MSKVLIVEDSPDCAGPLKRLLQLAGHEVRCAQSGLEALSLMRSFRPEKVVTDLMMPDMDGVAVIEAIRADQASTHIPIVVYTAGSNERIDRRLKALGVTAVHSKTELDVAALLQRVQRAGDSDPPAFSSPFSSL